MGEVANKVQKHFYSAFQPLTKATALTAVGLTGSSESRENT